MLGHARRRFVSITVIIAFVGTWSGAGMANRQQEIDSCGPGEMATWGDGQDRPIAQRSIVLVYRGASAAVPFADELVREMIERAAVAWSACGLTIRLAGEDEAAVRLSSRRVVIRWADRPIAGVAIADNGRGELLLNAKVFETLLQRRGQGVAQQTLQMTLSHELGHFLGMRAHSRRCVDVMSYYTSASGEKCGLRDPTEFGRYLEYRHILPTACDIARCKALNDPR